MLYDARMKRTSPTHATVLCGGLFITGLLFGSMTGSAAVARVQDPYAHLDLFARVLSAIEEDYVDVVPVDQLVDAAIRGMVRELDRQSRWLDADQLQDLRDDAEGTTSGIGIEVAAAAEGVEVVGVEAGSPAAREGLVAGDRILAIDGHELSGLPLDQVRGWVTGERGAHAKLTVLREGWEGPRVIDTVHDEITRRVVTVDLLPDGVAYVRLVQFQEGAADDIAAEVAHASRALGGPEGLSGLVLDLRDNPGGLLTEAIAVSDLFLDEGIIASTRARKSDYEAEVHTATPGGFPAALHTVVLVNGMSASASEIVAGALQDTGRATLVGTPTYGKGTVQQVYLHAAPEEAALKLTIGRYYTPSGDPVAPREGRIPDVTVAHPAPASVADRLRARLVTLPIDSDQRDEVLALLSELPAPTAARPQIAWDTPVAERAASDPQLVAALRALSGATPAPQPGRAPPPE